MHSSSSSSKGKGAMGKLFHRLRPDFIDYLQDESRLSGDAEAIAFPREEQEVQSLLAGAQDLPVTIQGARTGICGGAVPRGGVILNLSRMNRALGLRRDPEGGGFLLRAQPGVLLSQLNEGLAKRELPAGGWDAESLRVMEALRSSAPVFFAPDPTETGASLGGMAANNASGARSYAYGPTRAHLRALRLSLADGAALALSRGPSPRAQRASGLDFRLTAENGRRLEGRLPGYRMPDTKNAAGLYARPDMQLIDLVIGSEGTLGVLAELEIQLASFPPAVTGLMCFFTELPACLEFARRLRAELPTASLRTSEPDGLAAIEFFDRAALDLLGRQRQDKPAFAELPEIPVSPEAAVYAEIHARTKERSEDFAVSLARLLAECGGDEEATWIAEQPRQLVRLKDFRHALPEAVNLLIEERRRAEPGLTKLGTDMAVPTARLEEMFALYRGDLSAAGLEAVMFGHLGACHIHVNILPRSLEEYRRGQQLYESWAEAAIGMGGTVSAEHGIGKLKVELLRAMYGEQGLEQMRSTIEIFNPGFRLNRGNMVGYP
jgi:D-lactate dehydrogenase (cytochrome)